MYYTVYKVTNLINGKIYIGMHQTKDPNDDYKGSGVKITNALNFHGRENFTKEILAYCPNEEIMCLAETQFIKSYKESGEYEMYNLHEGGFGGNTTKFMSEEEKVNFRKKCSDGHKNMSEEKKRQHSESCSKSRMGVSRNKGRKHTQKENEAKSKRMKGDNHPFYNKTQSKKHIEKRMISRLLTLAKKRLAGNKYPNQCGFTRESDLKLINGD